MGEELATYNEELAAIANAAKKQEEGAAGGNFLKIGAGGIMSLNGANIPNNQMAVVVLDSIVERVYYRGAYDPNSPESPTCYAFGRDESNMAPHQKCVDAGTAQNPTCKGCKHDQFGTAAIGKGKACRQLRRVAMVAAGKYDANGQYVPISDPEYYKDAAVFYCRVPVTSVKAYAGWVTQVSGILGVTTFQVIAKVASFPDSKSTYRVTFETAARVSEDLVPVLLARFKEVGKVIEFPYNVQTDEGEEEGEAERPARRGSSKKKY